MKNKIVFFVEILSVSTVAATFCFLQPARRCQAQTTASNRFNVSIAAEQKTIMQGEPVPIALAFGNVPKGEMMAYTTDLKWCRFELRQGNKVVATWIPPEHSRPGFAMVQGFVGAETGNPVKAFVSGELTTVLPGDYDLAVVVTKPDNEKQRNVAGTLIVPLVVKPFDKTVIRNKISMLRKGILSSGKREEQSVLMRELSLMPASEAARTWRTLLLDSSVNNRYLLADILADAGTRPVVDTLLYVQFTHPLYSEQGQMLNLLTFVEGIKMSASSELKMYITQEVAKHRGSVYYESPPID